MAHPERLGKYQITGVLGEGAMGVVYRGFDPDIRRVVALKTIRHQGGQSPGALQQSAARFRNEAQAAGRLLHPGIVGVYDFGDDGRVAYIAMEYVEGHTLAQYLALRVAFAESDVASLATQLLEALAHAHEHGVWHRDIKPSNVIMTRSGRVKVADFGIARTDNSGLTVANSVLGTPMYMAPEQFMGHAIDQRVDLYGVGVVMYQLIAGRPPFVGPPESLMYKVVHELPLPPSSVASGTRSDRFDAVVAQALAKDPHQRHAHASAFRDAVAQAFGRSAPAAVSAEVLQALQSDAEYAPTERIVAGRPPAAAAGAPATGSGPPTHWDPAVLARAEAALARFVGPLAAVLVRRAAQACRDEPELYARLAEQITQSSARDAFLGRSSRSGTGSGSGFGALSTGAGLASQGGTTSHELPLEHAPSSFGALGQERVPVSDALLEQAERLLAAHVGPIARVLVRRAVARTRQREALFALLAESVPESARARLQAELSRLR